MNSPAMLHRAKKLQVYKLRCSFKNKEFKMMIPLKDGLTVKSFLNTFTEKNLKKNLNYKDFELYKEKTLEYVPYNYDIKSEFFNEKYKIFPSELTANSLMNKIGLTNISNYKILGLTDENINEGNNFFNFLLNSFSEHVVSSEYTERCLSLKNVLNTEAAIEEIESERKKFNNPWLYNSNTFKNVSMINFVKWDEIFYKNLLIQILNSAISLNENLKVDIDSTIEGLDTRSKNIDIYIKNKDNSFNIPINLINYINELKIYDAVRKRFYDYFFPKMYPLFMYELVNPNNPEDLNENVLKMLESVNKKSANIFEMNFNNEYFREFEFRSFNNYDTLKILSKHRKNLVRKTHIGISAHNDKLRFNLYRRPLDRSIETLNSIHRSKIFDLAIDLKDIKITNTSDFREFISLLNILTNLSSTELDNLYDDFMDNSILFNEEKELIENENKINNNAASNKKKRLKFKSFRQRRKNQK